MSQEAVAGIQLAHIGSRHSVVEDCQLVEGAIKEIILASSTDDEGVYIVGPHFANADPNSQKAIDLSALLMGPT